MTGWQQCKQSPVLAVILLLTAGLYVQVWQHTLIWDEHTLTTQQVVSHPSWANYQRSFQETYRPLALISVIVDHLIWRGWPPGYAVDSLAYHLLVVVLLFALARRWLTPFPAMTAALIAALHPVGAETVSYLLGRPDLLSAACLVAALLVFMNIERPDRRTLRLVVFWCLGLLALAAKETALLLPFLAVCVASPITSEVGDRREVLRSRMLAVVPFVVLFGLYATARVIGGGGWGGGGWASTGLPLRIHFTTDTLALMASTSAIALKALIWPVDLCPWYEGQNVVPASTEAAAGLLLLGLTGAAVTVWRLRRHAPAISLGLAWITGIVGLIAIRAAVSPAPMNPLAVRWLYPAMLGLAMIVGGCMQWMETGWPRASRVLILGLLALYAGANWQAQSIWLNDLSVFGRILQCSPHSPLITLQYAKLLERNGRVAEAEQLRSQLAREQPNHPIVLSQLLGDVISHGDYEQALMISKRLVAAKPSFSAIRKLADLELLLGQQHNAIEHYQQALIMRPDDPLTLTALGSLYERLREWQKAADLYSHNLTRHPTAANIWFRYGRVLERQGRFGEAETSYQHVIELDHLCPDGPLALAKLQERLGDLTAAATTRKRFATLTHLPLTPRPVTDATDSPCGMEIKAIYPRTHGQNPSVPP
jgi:tetratricopeptide (TPR) repeat protein